MSSSARPTLLLLVVCALVVTLPARAQEQVPIQTPPVGTTHGDGDTIVLKDGTVLKGTINEMTPGQAVTITTPNGQKRTIEWSALGSVDIARAKPAPPAVVPAATTTLHLADSDDDIVVQGLDTNDGSEAHWKTVCTGSCDFALPSGGLYRVGGPGLRTTKPFRIDGASAAFQITRGSSAAFAGGLTLTILGGAAVNVGVGLLLIAALNSWFYAHAVDMGPFAIAGGLSSGSGLMLMISGIALMKSNGHTRLTPLGPTRVVPAWREAQLPAWPRTARISIPIIAGTF
jgi:hypothetical protein